MTNKKKNKTLPPDTVATYYYMAKGGTHATM